MIAPTTRKLPSYERPTELLDMLDAPGSVIGKGHYDQLVGLAAWDKAGLWRNDGLVTRANGQLLA